MSTKSSMAMSSRHLSIFSLPQTFQIQLTPQRSDTCKWPRSAVSPSNTNDVRGDDDLVSENGSDENPFSFINFATDSGTLESANCLTTDSGDVAMEVDKACQTMPTHVLFNTDCNVLERKRFGNERSKTSSRFLQNIVAHRVIQYPFFTLSQLYFQHCFIMNSLIEQLLALSLHLCFVTSRPQNLTSQV